MSAEGFMWATVFTLAAGVIWYIRLLYKDLITPAPAAWIIGTIAMSLSWATYWDTEDPSFVGNIGIIASFGSTTIITGYYLTLLWMRGKLYISFTWFQYFALLLTAFIVLLWKYPQYFALTEGAKMSYWALQAILILAHIVVVQKIIAVKKNIDSIVMWIVIGVASLFAWKAALINDDIYGIWNTRRIMISSLVIIPLMIFYDLQNRRWSRSKN